MASKTSRRVFKVRRKATHYFSASHAHTWDEFILGTLLTGLMIGIGWSLGSIIIRGTAQKLAGHKEGDILSLGLK